MNVMNTLLTSSTIFTTTCIPSYLMRSHTGYKPRRFAVKIANIFSFHMMQVAFLGAPQMSINDTFHCRNNENINQNNNMIVIDWLAGCVFSGMAFTTNLPESSVLPSSIHIVRIHSGSFSHRPQTVWCSSADGGVQFMQFCNSHAGECDVKRITAGNIVTISCTYALWNRSVARTGHHATRKMRPMTLNNGKDVASRWTLSLRHAREKLSFRWYLPDTHCTSLAANNNRITTGQQ